MAKTVDHLKGIKDEPDIIRRPYPYHTRSSEIFEDFSEQSVLHGVETAITLFVVGEVQKDQDERPETVDREELDKTSNLDS